MDPRQLLSMLMSKGSAGGSPVGADEYQQLLEERMGRYHGDRDAAVRSANIAGGFGNSTAQRFMHDAAAAPDRAAAAAAADPVQTAAIPQPRPPVDPGIGSGIPIPEPGIGSGIPMPQLSSDPRVETPASAPIPTRRPGGLTIGSLEPGIGSGIPTPPGPTQTTAIPQPRPENLPITEAPPQPLRAEAPVPKPRPRKGKAKRGGQYRLG